MVVQQFGSLTFIVITIGEGYLLIAVINQDFTFQLLELEKVNDIKILNLFLASATHH